MSAPSSPAEEEAAPLIPPDPSDLEAGRRSEASAANSILSFGEDRKYSDPLYVKIFYSLSVLVSIGGLIAAAVGFSIVCRNVFDKSAQRDRWRSYTEYPWGMLMPILLMSINVFWSSYNLYWATKGKQHRLWFLNMIYDFGIWGLLIAAGVLNMVLALWDRRLCDGWDDEEKYKTCDAAMYDILVAELVAVNMGILVAVLHFILLVARCCFLPGQFDKDTEIELRDMIREERLQLEALAERRMRLIEENRRLEERLERSLPPLPRDRSLPPLPHEGSEFGDYHDNVEEAPQDGEHQEQLSPQAEDLIDVGRPSDNHGDEHHMTTNDANNQSR